MDHMARLWTWLCKRIYTDTTILAADKVDLSTGRNEEQMEGQKWEELNMDCLVNVLGRVGMESLLLDIPFVCKSWYKATLNPLCWKRLVFPEISLYGLHPDPFRHRFVCRLIDEFQISRDFSSTAFIKFVINRSRGSASTIVFSDGCTEEELIYVSEECPALEQLVLPCYLSYDDIPILFCKWKSLLGLRIGNTFKLPEVITQISIHCNNFIALAVTSASIDNEDASAIVTLLPNLKYLYLTRASIKRENLVTILQGCRQLEHLDVRKCIGFEGDDEILKLASHIRTFKYEGSRIYDVWRSVLERDPVIYDDDSHVIYDDDEFHDGNSSD